MEHMTRASIDLEDPLALQKTIVTSLQGHL